MSTNELYVGLMSGTSLDGVDGVLADLGSGGCRTLAASYLAFPPALRAELMTLQVSGAHELHRSALAGLALAEVYADAVQDLLRGAPGDCSPIRAIGCHGQTVRHLPAQGYTLQINNPARLVERTGITVVADFRSRDIAAGGQGAPLVPGFHAVLFGRGGRHSVVVNLGGIANITDLPCTGDIRGWDTGPGTVLFDAWCERHTGAKFDLGGAWAASGRELPDLLDRLVCDPYFSLPPPKSTGRELFCLDWLDPLLEGAERAEDVQATLVGLTATAIADAVQRHCAPAQLLVLCGGGALNRALVARIESALSPRTVICSDRLQVPVNHVEPLAFAWLARQAILGLPGNLPAVTGARGHRILGAIYPA